MKLVKKAKLPKYVWYDNVLNRIFVFNIGPRHKSFMEGFVYLGEL